MSVKEGGVVIKISRGTRDALKGAKRYRRETYDETILQLLSLSEEKGFGRYPADEKKD
jgi:hypothetical protein